MWSCNTFRAKILQYLKAILFKIKYTVNHDDACNYNKDLFIFLYDRVKTD